jgi:hypothetical protein
MIGGPMAATTEKARAQRLQRLRTMLDQRLDNPAAAVEFLISELVAKQPQPELWEKLHGAADRDEVELELAAAYAKVTSPRRLAQLEPSAQAAVLMHAADFHQGVIGDSDGAQEFLERVQHIVPGHAESFARLERRFSSLGDQRRLIELYAIVGAAEPKLTDKLATLALNKIVPLPATQPLSEEACKRVVALAQKHPALFEVLDAHCRKTKRFGLACELIELSLSDPKIMTGVAVKQRRRLIELCIGEAASPARAIDHIESLLNDDPSDAIARAGAERLLSHRDIAPRAAAALQAARRLSRLPSPG